MYTGLQIEDHSLTRKNAVKYIEQEMNEMPKPRNRYTAEFKKRVVLAAMKEDKTLAQLASEFGVGGDLISVWKKQAMEGMEAIFERGEEASKTKELEHDKERLFQQVGKLSYELDWLKKKCGYGL
jgi:transposase